MMATTQIIPVTDFRNKIKEVLEQIKLAPVILTQRSRPAAVVVDYDTYQEQMEHLEELELRLDGLLLAQAIKSSEGLVPLDELFADYEEKTGNKLE
jgi:prevent-host-death family protein